MFNSLMPSLNIRSLPFVVFMGGFPSRLQNLSSGAIRPGGLLFMEVGSYDSADMYNKGKKITTSFSCKSPNVILFCMFDYSGGGGGDLVELGTTK